MWPPPFSRPTRRRRRIHINLADFYAPVELILASIAWPRFLRPPLADSPGRGNCHHVRDGARRPKADLTSSQPTKDDHRGNQTKQNGNQDATELACGCGAFPAVQPRAMPRRYGAFYRRGGLKRCHCSSLSPRFGQLPRGSDEQMFGAKQQNPWGGAKRLRNTANDGYSDEKMCPMSRKTRIRCPLP